MTPRNPVLEWGSDGRASLRARVAIEGSRAGRRSRVARKGVRPERDGYEVAGRSRCPQKLRGEPTGVSRKGERTKRIRVPARGRRRTDSKSSPLGELDERIPKFRQRMKPPDIACDVRGLHPVCGRGKRFRQRRPPTSEGIPPTVSGDSPEGPKIAISCRPTPRLESLQTPLRHPLRTSLFGSILALGRKSRDGNGLRVSYCQ